MFRRSSVILCCCLGSSPAGATETSLGEIQVQAPGEGMGTAAHDRTLFSTVITADDLKGRRTSLPEILSETSGLTLRRYGGLDDFATVSIRGSTSEQVDIFLDGILLNPAAGGGVNLATVPLEQIERIEIYRGAAPARFGSSTIGGVIHIKTKGPQTAVGAPARQTDLSGSFGSFTTVSSNLLHTQSIGHNSFAVGYGFSHSRGDFTYDDDNGTPFNLSDDEARRRENNAFLRHDLLTHFRRPLTSDLNLEFHNNFFREDRGIPGLGTLRSEEADLSTTRNGTRLHLEKKNLWSHGGLSLSPFFQFVDQRFRDLEGEIGLGTQDNDNETYQYGNDLLAESLVGEHHRFTALLHYQGEQFLPKDFVQSPPAGPKSVRNEVGLSLEDEIYIGDDLFVLSPSIRTDHVFDDFADRSTSRHPVTGKLGLAARPTSHLTLKSNFSRSHRLPSFTELFGDRGTVAGNDDLVPETAWNWDIGGGLHWERIRVETSWYLNHLTDLIQFLQTSQFTVQARNLSRARIQGVETTLVVSPLPWLEFSGNYTFQLATDISGLPATDGNRLPGRPVHEANLKGSAHHRWGRLFASLEFMDNNFLDQQNVRRIDHRVFLGAGVSLNFLKRFTASFEAKNLLNDRVSDVVGFPLPQRSTYGKLEVRI